MNTVPKMLIIIGIVFIVIGVIWYFGGRYLSFGKLPGDIVVKRENFSFYFPIVTCIVISIIISVIAYIIRLFK